MGNRVSLLCSAMLSLLIVLLVSWPVLKAPRPEADDYRYLHHIQQRSAGNTGLEAHVLEGGVNGAMAIEFILPEPLDTYQILVWEADRRNLNEHPWIRRKNATVRLGERL